MERRLSDNAGGERGWNNEPNGPETALRAAERRRGPLLHPSRIDWVVPHPPEGRPVNAPIALNAGQYGTCLYFGPGGERCDRPALEGGFCRRHLRRTGEDIEPDERDLGGEQAPVITAKRVLAFLAALAASWPVVADFVRELLRHIK